MPIETILSRIQTDPTTGTATAFFESRTVADGIVFVSPWTNVSWPIAVEDQTVEVDGITLTYYQVSQAVTAIAYQAKALADATPEPPEPEPE